MKTTLLSVALLIAILFNSNAQSRTAVSTPYSLKNESVLVGANGSGSFSSSRLGTGKAFLVAPSVGYLVQDRLVTGLSLTLSNDKFSSKDSNLLPDKDNTNISPEVFARYYLFSGKLKPFAELGVGYNFLRSDESTINNAYVSPTFGLSYWIGQRFALEAVYKPKLQSGAARQIDPAAGMKFRVGFSVGIY